MPSDQLLSSLGVVGRKATIRSEETLPFARSLRRKQVGNHTITPANATRCYSAAERNRGG